MATSSHSKDYHALCIGAIIDDLEIIQVLNSSAHRQVSLAKDINSFQRYVIKSLPYKHATSHQLLLQKNEILLHSRLSGHPHVIRFERVIQGSDWTHIVLEYGYEGDLFTAIAEKDMYYGNHTLIRCIFLQLIEAVQFCHNNGVYHRDLKPENILIFDQGRTVKIADFGLATMDRYSKDYGCGSKFYFSPECQGGFLMDSQIGYATAPNDVWSLGIILINLAASRNPWHTASLEDATYCAFLKDPDLLLNMLPISSELNYILKRVFCLDPLKRITLDELYLRVQQCTYFTCPHESNASKAILENTQDNDRFNIDLPTPPDTPNIARDTFSGTGPQDALFPKIEAEI